MKSQGKTSSYAQRTPFRTVRCTSSTKQPKSGSNSSISSISSNISNGGRQRYFSIPLGLLLSMDYELLKEPSAALEYVVNATEVNDENEVFFGEEPDTHKMVPGKGRKLSLEESLIWLFDGEESDF